MNWHGMLVGIVGVTLAAVVSACHEQAMTVKQLLAWHQGIGIHASWPRYQGSDSRFHHFAVYAFTDVYVFRIARSELKLSEEHPYSKHAAGTFAYYEVDPYDNFRKIEKPLVPNQASEPTRASVTPPATAGERASGARGSP
jgi:hypothetical protein